MSAGITFFVHADHFPLQPGLLLRTFVFVHALSPRKPPKACALMTANVPVAGTSEAPGDEVRANLAE
jgi:hypothetical protein